MTSPKAATSIHPVLLNGRKLLKLEWNERRVLVIDHNEEKESCLVVCESESSYLPIAIANFL